MVEILDIDKTSFDRLRKCEKLFESHSANTFLTIRGETFVVGLGWDNSYIQKPVFLELTKYNLLIIGLSDRVFAIESSTGSILFALGLHDALIALDHAHLGFVIITETTITRINASNCSYGSFNSVPDIVSHYQIVDNEIHVKTVTGEALNFKI